MADFFDLLRKAETDPEGLKELLKDPAKHGYTLTSAELDALKKIDPAALRTIAGHILRRELASSQACQACADRERIASKPIQ